MAQLREVNTLIEFGIQKLESVTFGITKPKKSRNKSKSLYKSKSKASIRPRKPLMLKLSKNNKLGKSSKIITNMNSKVSSKNSKKKKVHYSTSRSKSILKNRRPIDTRFQERLKKKEGRDIK